ncbi:hypothetical protein DITRI_Ditri05aG0102500 [Diplodiscus trichospermus]
MRSPYPFLVFILTFVPCIKFASSAICDVDDEKGLLGFKSGITQDPSGMLSTWKSGTGCCTWAGITCNSVNQVTSISLFGQLDKPKTFLSGTISSSLLKLHNLDSIYLQNLRNISGSFPLLVFGLPKLKFVYLENNKLSGQIPLNIGNLSQLQALSLAGNRFTGPIPTSIYELTQLTQLNLAKNLLTGQFPIGIKQLRNLTFLSLEQNKLSGTIPDIFKSFSNLRSLILSRNAFSGKLPESISFLAPRLMYLEISHNALSGQIPSFLGNFRALDTLDLSWNLFTGVVPKSFANLTKIFNLDLSNNALTDPFPIMNVKGCPVGLLNRTDYLVEFKASENKLRFDLEKLKIVKTLKELDISGNLVYGKVPTGVTGLENLNLSYNNLCGQLPMTTFPASAFVGNDCLCGSPLPSCKV